MYLHPEIDILEYGILKDIPIFDDYWEYSLFHLLQDDQRFISAYT